MTPDATLLEKLAEWKPPDSGRHTLVVPADGGGWTVAVTADRNNDLGCRVWEIVAERPAPAAGAAGLKEWAHRTAARVTGLLEPLRVVEVDGPRNEALLRSQAPAERGAERHYYEVRLTGTHRASVRRYQGFADGGQPRQQVAFPLTHEAIAKLVGDVTADS